MVERTTSLQTNNQNHQQDPQRRTLENLLGIANNLAQGERDINNFQQINGQTLQQTNTMNNVSMSFNQVLKMVGNKSKLIELIKSQGLLIPSNQITIDQLVHNWIKQFWPSQLNKAPKSITRKNCVKVLNTISDVQNGQMRVSELWNADYLKDLAYTKVPNHPCWTQNRYDFSIISTQPQPRLGQNETTIQGNIVIPDSIFQNISNTRNRRIEIAISDAIGDLRQQDSQPTQQVQSQSIPQQNQNSNILNTLQNDQSDQELSRFLDYDGNFVLQEGEQLVSCPICLVSDNRMFFLRCCGGPMHPDCLNHNLNSSRRCPFCRAPNARLQRRPLRRNQIVIPINNEPQQEEQKNQNDDADDEESAEGNENNVNQSQDV